MDQFYQPIYKQVADMQHQFHDYSLPNAHDPTANLLRNEIHQLTNDLASNKSPRTIENRIKVIEQQLRRTEINNPTHYGQTPLMNYNHSNQMLDHLKNIQVNVRQHPHF